MSTRQSSVDFAFVEDFSTSDKVARHKMLLQVHVSLFHAGEEVPVNRNVERVDEGKLAKRAEC